MLPSPVTATFSLSAAFPMQWQLTRICTTFPGAHEDLTAGFPPNAVVAPPGGQWTTPVLTVTLTMSPSYLVSIQAGDHHFFMTGVNQRGLSSHAELVLKVQV